MEADWTILPVLIVIFLATLIRSAFGFGEALVAVPLLALLIPVEEAVPLATLLSITVAAIVVAQDWHKIHLLSASWLVLSTFVGIPLGLWLLTGRYGIGRQGDPGCRHHRVFVLLPGQSQPDPAKG